MVKRRRFSEDIADSVLDKVIEMGLKPGDRLPTHNQLSEILGVSLPSLREGLSLLSLSGVINITHGAGTTLVNPVPEDYFKMLKPVFKINAPKIEEILDFFNLFIQDLADACLKKAESSISLLNTLIHSDALTERGKFINYHKEFHTFLASTIENPLKSSAFLFVLNLYYHHLSLINLSEDSIYFYIESHKILMTCLHNRDKNDVEEALGNCYKIQLAEKYKVSLDPCRFGTGSLGGSFYTMAKRFTNIFRNEENIDIQLELTGGGIENITLTEEGKTILSLTQSDIAEAAYRAKGLFSKEHTQLRVVCGVKSLDLYIVSFKDRKIANLYDLKGRRVAMGAEGGGSGEIARTILKNLGFDAGDYRPYYLSFSNALQGLSSNEIDVVFFLAHEMPSAIKDLVYEEELQFIYIPEEMINSLEKQSSFWKRSSYKSGFKNTEKINTISVAAILITGASVSEELVCRIAEVLKDKSEKSDHISFSVSDTDLSIPFHTGVLKCLK